VFPVCAVSAGGETEPALSVFGIAAFTDRVDASALLCAVPNRYRRSRRRRVVAN